MRRTRRRALVALAAPLAVGLAALTGCSSGGQTGDTSGSSSSKEILTLGMTADIQGWDPAVQPSYQGWSADAVWDSLLRCDKTGKPGPSLADKWEFSADQKTATLHIRDGVKFSDGTPVDAAAVKANAEYYATAGGAASRWAGITVQTPDTHTVAISWPAPNPLLALRMCESKIATPASIAGKKFDVPVGSGPYTLDVANTTRGSVYTFTKNDSFWDSSRFPYKKLVLKVLEDETAAVNALKTEQIDGTIVSSATLEEAKAAGENIQTLKGSSTTRLLITDHLGQKIPALGNVDVRKAMNMVFDRDAMSKKLYLGHATPAYQIFREGSDAYIPDMKDPYPFNVDEAKKLMAKAGYADGFTLQIPTMTGQGHETLMPYITQQLAQINIKVEQVQLSGPNAISELLSGKFPVPLWQLGNYGESLQDISDYVLKDGIWNVSHEPDAKVDALWNKVLTGSDADRKQAEQDINKYVTDQAWFVPMAFMDRFYASNPKVSVQESSDFSGLHPLLRDFK
jgi:peptide/nickel transport system substrate-binding protein